MDKTDTIVTTTPGEILRAARVTRVEYRIGRRGVETPA